MQNNKVAVLGLGVNHRNLVTYFDRNGISYEVLEWTSPKELTQKLSAYDVVFRSPGLPFESEAIQTALKKGIEIYSQTKLFFDLCPAPIIGVTGTKGKGTTSTLIARILEASGKKVWLAGNVGKDPFEFLDQIKPSDLVVLELSSFQLQDLHKSPKFAVVLEISPDHLNHHKDFDEYIEAKSNILKYQKPEDFAVLSPRLPDWFSKLGEGKKIFFDPRTVEGYERKLLGKHNLDNISAAAVTCSLLDVSEEIIKKTVRTFDPLPHRLNMIKEINGVKIVDDAFSTNIPPVLAAIDAFVEPKILIVGGFDKGLDWTPLGEKIKKNDQVKALIVIGQVAPKILDAVKGYQGKILKGENVLWEILMQAFSLATAGDVVIFSPGTSSFDMFKNEFDRGEQFVNAVNNL